MENESVASAREIFKITRWNFRRDESENLISFFSSHLSLFSGQVQGEKVESPPKRPYRLIRGWVYKYISNILHVLSSLCVYVDMRFYRTGLLFLTVCWSGQIFRMRDSNDR